MEKFVKRSIAALLLALPVSCVNPEYRAHEPLPSYLKTNDHTRYEEPVPAIAYSIRF